MDLLANFWLLAKIFTFQPILIYYSPDDQFSFVNVRKTLLGRLIQYIRMTNFLKFNSLRYSDCYQCNNPLANRIGIDLLACRSQIL